MVEVTRFNSKLIQFEDFKWFPILRRPIIFYNALKEKSPRCEVAKLYLATDYKD
ncbi:hypothetical protein FLACOL7796_01937 [Flavobacterium collinsii]|jgi:hypothetical protein|uniref:Uncharacterized protein n=1 Tax=Flavobacterium collinsii TaxID=1114861 RepID=A0ABM8KJ30_9FLAO|nr:hypothetical protein FLACOL7796_01937 [Flavobacterium collinsii]